MSIKKIIVNGEPCWSYDVMINGHRLRKASKKWSRKQAAEEERLAILNYGQSEKITFGELAQIYFKHKKAEIKESSYRRLFNSCKNHILPFFSEMVVNDLTNKDIERWLRHSNKKRLWDALLNQSFFLPFGITSASLF